MWALKRRLIFLLTFIILLTGITLFTLKGVLFPEPRCDDGKKNGFETGIDCGGSCSLRCTEDTIPLQVVWAKPFPVKENIYDVAVLISNKNRGSSPRSVTVEVTVLDGGGAVLYTKSAAVPAPRGTDFPVFFTNLRLQKKPIQVKVKLVEDKSYALSEEERVLVFARSQFDALSMRRVMLSLKNQSGLRLDAFPVRVVLYGSGEVPLAVGETKVSAMNRDAETAAEIVWPTPFAEAPVTVRAYPIIDPYKIEQRK